MKGMRKQLWPWSKETKAFCRWVCIRNEITTEQDGVSVVWIWRQPDQYACRRRAAIQCSWSFRLQEVLSISAATPWTSPYEAFSKVSFYCPVCYESLPCYSCFCP